jgi:hypothetical protein
MPASAVRPFLERGGEWNLEAASTRVELEVRGAVVG